VSTYYTPHRGQTHYWNGSYAQEFYINCQGDCLSTASGYKLSEKDISKVVACPPSFKFGTVLEIEDVGRVVCRDRGGAIKGRRLDLWVGIGQDGHDRVGQGSGWKNVTKLYVEKS